MTTYAVRLTRTQAADEEIFSQATEGCRQLADQLHAAIAREYPADQARELVAALEQSARPNFLRCSSEPRRSPAPAGQLMSIAVRPVTSADAPALAELLNAIIARGGTTALQTPFTPERLDQTYLTGPNVLSCVVAVDGASGRPEGFQTLIREVHLPADWGDIGTFTRVGGTQRGVGSALFAATSEPPARSASPE